MTYRLITTRREGAVEYLTLNRPEFRNAFNEEMIAELDAWAADAGRDGGLRAVVLSGAGKVFSAGADVAWMSKSIGYTKEENRRDALAASHLFAALDRLPMPLVGRVQGAALGGGAGLAAVCDIVVADEQASFGFTEVKLGILPAVISPFVVAKIGRTAARELFLTGARFPAARAKEIGLVQAVVPLDGLDETVAGYVGEILTGAPGAITAAKALIRDVWGRPLGETTERTVQAIAAHRVSAEGQEGLKAFLEKRRPAWAERTTRNTKDTKGTKGTKV